MSMLLACECFRVVMCHRLYDGQTQRTVATGFVYSAASGLLRGISFQHTLSRMHWLRYRAPWSPFEVYIVSQKKSKIGRKDKGLVQVAVLWHHPTVQFPYPFLLVVVASNASLCRPLCPLAPFVVRARPGPIICFATPGRLSICSFFLTVRASTDAS